MADVDWRDILTHHAEDSWQELFRVATDCAALNLADPTLVHLELIGLKERLRDARANGDAVQIEACLNQCKHLLLYYRTLQKQKRRVDETGSPFAKWALERLMAVKDREKGAS